MGRVSEISSLDLIGLRTKRLNILETSDGISVFEGSQC